ncbi:MAG TPA: bifunctional YncE family protein/alkaline phosphatase family protein [Tepidisphaeraceae bacterium]|nr:bifunctional YncE family protein/alkaline phosphatase family protein [Tepidisphaeraceae bacterium]
MKIKVLAGLAAVAAAVFVASPTFGQAKPRPIPTGPASVLQSLPNELFSGWKLTPAGRHVGVTSMPLKMVVSPDGKTLAAVCAGRWNGLALIDLATETTRQWVPLYRTFNGVAFSRDGKQIFVTGGNSDRLYVFDFDGQKVRDEPTTIHLGNQPKGSQRDNFFAGMTIDPDTGKLYLCNEGTSEIWVFDPATSKIEAKWRTEAHPYACAFGTEKKFLFVSNWGDGSVSALDPQSGTQVARIGVGMRPNEMAVAPDGRLFVCCAGDNTVRVLQTQSPHDDDRANKTNQKGPPPTDALEIISTSLYPSSPEGSTPNAVAVSADGKTLFVANADNNDVMVADIADAKSSRVVGFVPTGWYPCAVATDGNKLFVANGKGLESSPSFPSKRPENNVMGGVPFDPPLHILSGSVSIIDPPNGDQLLAYTKQVRDNCPYVPQDLKLASEPNQSVIPSKVGDQGACPIKHVLYIIKENRTYDQMFGDMTDNAGKRIGNGNADICMFGDSVSPNQHQLARDYVLMDNLYVMSEVSWDGHAWCDSAISTDYGQRVWITNYTTHGHLPGNGETNATLAGNIWDACKRAGVSYKCYGEGAWDAEKENRGTWPGGRDPQKAQGWIKDLHDAERTGDLPSFMIMSLGENHTAGTTPGAFTPQAMVASNDQAVGQIVDAASHSKFWNQMAIFIVEDDAQNGPDHVDAHRTDGLVISPYVKRNTIDSTHYTQMSMLRTMELILGLHPLTQFDAAATPMFNLFTTQCVSTPFTNIAPKTDLLAKNAKTAPGAEASAKMNFEDYDDAPEDELNRILWAAVKGEDTPYPTPIHRALFAN